MKREVEKRQFGPLSGLYIPGVDVKFCVVLLHGYGADAEDLATLARVLGLSEKVAWFFPNASLRIPIGPGIMGRAWFPIEPRELVPIAEKGPYYSERPSGISKARDAVLKMLFELQNLHSEVILGGFSQGAMVALESAFVAKIKPRALVVMSGTVVDAAQWEKRAPSCQGVPFILSHGRSDPLLSCQGGEVLFDLLSKAGLKGEKCLFSGGHEIPQDIIFKIKEFLQAVVA